MILRGEECGVRAQRGVRCAARHAACGGTRALLAVVLLVLVATWVPSTAWADAADGGSEDAAAQAAESGEGDGSGDMAQAAASESAAIDISADGDAARIEGAPFAIEGFQRSQTGSNRSIDGVRYGYTYRLDAPDMLVAVNTAEYVVVYVPQGVAERFGLDVDDEATQNLLRDYLEPLDAGLSQGSVELAQRETWYFTDEPAYTVGEITFEFGRELKEGYYYVVLSGPTEDFDVKSAVGPANMDSCELVATDKAVIEQERGPLEQLAEFLATMDYSPLWVTLRTCGVAIVFVFFLGLAAAYFTMRISKRAQDIFDTIFTIPMVLPPTVCGFLLLMLLGRNTAFGQFFQEIGFPLVFSWQATVIAAVVVAFPLMYRSARGAFESLDANMLDAARTLGWSNGRIFAKLMLPLAWSSIASGTVLAFARALGEFGCTLFLAGNQLGSTRTIPIAIYFEWMNGNQAATWFWTIVLIVFSFVVILFINLWSRHTTRYRQQPRSDGRSPKPRRQGTRGGKGSTRGMRSEGAVPAADERSAR